MARSPPSRLRAIIVVEEHALGRTGKILVLTAPERPEERPQANRAEGERDRYQIDKRTHSAACIAGATDRRPAAPRRESPPPTRGPPLSRIALATTSTDEHDITKAARSGVTSPATTTGRAIAL